jgi:hypothetical protein
MIDYPLDFTPQCPQVAWLCEHLGGWQFGEQDLLLAVVETLEINGTCVEIGAGDGETLPLTIDRLYHHGLGCMLFESDESRREKLSLRYPDALVCGKYTGGDFEWRREARQKFADISTWPDMAVIDVDGVDSVLMKGVMYMQKPAVVVCEHMDRNYPIGTSSSSPFPVWSLGHELLNGFRIQDTAETLQWMAANLEYERFGYNRCNSFFVRRDRFTDLFR